MSRREFLRLGVAGLAAALAATKGVPGPAGDDWDERRAEIMTEFETAQRKPRFL